MSIEHFDTDFCLEHRQRAIAQAMEWYGEWLSAHLDYATVFSAPESPLEASFLIWWRAFESSCCIYEREVSLVAQPEVFVGPERYRIDFALEPYHETRLYQRAEVLGLPIVRVGIELDGHEFHEKTRAQVTRRDKRDRDLQMAGWRVFHFSGSEFNRRPQQCIQDVYGSAVEIFADLARAVSAAERRPSTEVTV